MQILSRALIVLVYEDGILLRLYGNRLYRRRFSHLLLLKGRLSE